jgi:type II secretory pathway pseudopilin PulG
MSRKYHPLYNGFTLLEFVILLIGILSVTVAIKLTARNQHSVTIQADEFRRNLSHIQLLAISKDQRLRLSVNSGGYTVATCTTSACSATNPLTDPATGQNFSVSLIDGVTFSSASTLDFDSLGRPQTGGNLIAANPARSYTLGSSGRSVTVTVLPITGFAQTSY